jgi:nucleotidyltransferase/DNA polymerase involved in DNA repair
MTPYGYARVSTDGQTLDAQLHQLRVAGAEKVFSEKVSQVLRHVVADRPRKSSGSETTFERDLTASAEIEAGVEAMADDVWAWCEKAKAFGRTVTVKAKFADFQQVTRSRSFATVIARHDLVRRASVELVRTLLPTAKGVRLIGVAVSNFDQAPADADDELPLFGAGGVITPPPDTAPCVAATGAR